ncbi:beta-galactosidase GalB [Mangrovibacterium sp.]|uniref:beta-galactosidase GalB n=1 Tax=Mangrovibacterium sp. TaxID=1961364 RepID=UPI003563AE7C
MKRKQNINLFLLAMVLALVGCGPKSQLAERQNFDKDWRFLLGDDSLAFQQAFDDSQWRKLNLPHDWSIEGEFSADAPATPEGGALPTGTGWYRKTFKLEKPDEAQVFYIDFDGVMANSEVWINGHYLGKRPFGYISFRYDLTPYLKFGEEGNTLAVRVDNSAQPASRWYTGSGIYRHVWLVEKNPVHVAHWGTFVTTPEVSAELAKVKLDIQLENRKETNSSVVVKSTITDADGQAVAEAQNKLDLTVGLSTLTQNFELKNPALWSPENPNLYTISTQVLSSGKLVDQYETPLGVRFFEFTADQGFFLNGTQYKLHGVNQHHDLGALGAAVNTRAMERQLEILKDMGVNAIRMAHNPPAPELLQLCDRMGFLVIDESFDEWKKRKAKQGYHLYWDDWHKRDLEDMILRDRNHPSIFVWSIGNEIPEQFDTTGIRITRELADIVKSLDTTRPVTAALTETDPEKNNLYKSGALDLLSFNYKHKEYLKFPDRYPGECMLASENMSALSTRGQYDFPSDSVRIWPPAYNSPFDGNADLTASSFDNCIAYWGATHEDTWAVVKNNEFIPGMFIWSGFDYIGEPLPYPYPARSSYLGIIDLCGFPKDAYYMYQSEWSDKTVLHLFPHWNWDEGQIIDLWAYYNNADEVELFVNGVSQGRKSKATDKFHVMWRVPFHPGSIKAISYKDGQEILEQEIKTAGPAAKIELIADRSKINANGTDLSFITVKVTDKDGNMVPDAANLINFNVEGEGFVAGVDNGYQASTEPFKANYRKVFNGMCLLIVQSTEKAGTINVTASSEGLDSNFLTVTSN